MNIVKDIRREAERDPPAPPPRKRMKNNSVGARSRSVRGSQALLARVFLIFAVVGVLLNSPLFDLAVVGGDLATTDLVAAGDTGWGEIRVRG